MKPVTYLVNTREYISLFNTKSVYYILGDVFPKMEYPDINTILLKLGTTKWNYKNYISYMLYNLSFYITLSSYENIKSKDDNLFVVNPLLKMYFLTAIIFQTTSHNFKISVDKNCEEYKRISELLLSLEIITDSFESDDLWKDVKQYKKFITLPHTNNYLKHTNVDAYENILIWIIHRLAHVHNFDIDSLFKAYIESVNDINTNIDLDLIKSMQDKVIYLYDAKLVKDNKFFTKKVI